MERLQQVFSSKDALSMKALGEMMIHGRKNGFVLPGGRGVNKPHKDDRVGL
jgi:hypothetical protein